MAGGGTGGHVVPSLAVATELKQRGHEILFIGTRRGLESKLVPAAGFPIEWIEIGGLNRVGWKQAFGSLVQLPASVARSRALLDGAAAVFSMGGYVAGPVMLAGWLRRTPMVLMEANAMPGMVSRVMGRVVRKALISFPEAASHFPPGRSELTGLPVREAFFAVEDRAPGREFTVLMTGGSRGAKALNRAAREMWPRLKNAGWPVRLILQCGAAEHETLSAEFAKVGLAGEVTPFITDMAGVYAQADLVVSRSGAGAVSELAAAGKPSILVPFPFAADNHQYHNALAMQGAGAATLLPESELTGESLFREVERLQGSADCRQAMGRAARGLAKRGAAQRAAELLEEMGKAH